MFHIYWPIVRRMNDWLCSSHSSMSVCWLWTGTERRHWDREFESLFGRRIHIPTILCSVTLSDVYEFSVSELIMNRTQNTRYKPELRRIKNYIFLLLISPCSESLEKSCWKDNFLLLEVLMESTWRYFAILVFLPINIQVLFVLRIEFQRFLTLRCTS